MVGLRTAEESPGVADDPHMLRIAVIDLENEGSLLSQYSESLTTALTEGSMPSYDVKITKQRLNTITTLLEALQLANRRRRHGKKFSFRQKPIPDDQWDACHSVESAAINRPNTGPVSLHSSANIIASREGDSFDIEVSSSSEVYTLEELTNCTVRFSGQSSGNLPAAIYIHGVRKSLVSVTSEGISPDTPVGPVLLCYDCRDSIIQLSGCVARQLRIHTSHGMLIYANATATPIIEDCTRIAIGRSFDVPQSPVTVADFSYLQADGVSPNWRPIPDQSYTRRGEWDGHTPPPELIGLFV
ncbi:hypothetical protein Pmar_PMAR005121 [Perkinsus marinus ATCC 50983]|uniref:C-CAP/cofactor C-like domain-containing protein n=1 Tax=Perkinsus marinus (strain ATCC 50983 / TXsc) TaxID=423536 RepID=C5KAP0_PERM5|nr:hypothetical protein Pmar_PMAR005121 [Perkinsus marinus ATCC 50983]EER18216.1 hypothetical protein Pmar_PMAR005121 [Perkinsus marinus ATCC 50983]|eukprot:XP_002786420.1 hypothetical protein Pmar_PMAR005121 [Perkinsus marinus ATCC 50983]